MEWYEEEVCAMEQRLREYPPPEGLVVFYGSSSMRLWESLSDDFPQVGVLNLAFGGSTMEACALFFERLVVPCRPRSIVCYAGDNDLGDGRSPEDVVASFQKLLDKVDFHFPAIPFIMMSIKPSPARWHLVDQIKQTNNEIRRIVLARKEGCFVDIFPAMMGNDDRPDESLFLEDGLHVSSKGYLIWKKLLQSQAHHFF